MNLVLEIFGWITAVYVAGFAVFLTGIFVLALFHVDKLKMLSFKEDVQFSLIWPLVAIVLGWLAVWLVLQAYLEAEYGVDEAQTW